MERSLHRILFERQFRLFQRLLRLPVEAQGLHNQTLAAGRLTLTEGEHLLENAQSEVVFFLAAIDQP